MTPLTFRAYGDPKPKGSTRAFVVRKKGEDGPGRAVVVPTNKAPAKQWAGAVAEAASRALEAQRQGVPFDGAVRVSVVFALARPKSLPKAVTFHTKKPDCDKLARLVGDALAHVVYHDDACVVEWHLSKCYAMNTAPHIDVTVEAMDRPVPIAGVLFEMAGV